MDNIFFSNWFWGFESKNKVFAVGLWGLIFFLLLKILYITPLPDKSAEYYLATLILLNNINFKAHFFKNHTIWELTVTDFYSFLQIAMLII